MKRAHHLLSGSIAVILFAGMVALGCGESDSGALAPAAETPRPDYDPNDQYGGLTVTDEEPAFGDPELLEEAALEVGVDDNVGELPEIDDMDGDPTARIYALAIAWGDLPGREQGCRGSREPDGMEYDWSGSVTVTSGAVVLKNTISFERPLGDHVILPRPDRQTIEWVSHTGCGYDGLRLLVYRPGGDADSSEGVLSFETELYSREIPISDLAGLDEVVDVDANGNQVRFLGSLIRPRDHVGHGFLRGRWGVMAPGDSVGHFQGVMVRPRGEVDGYMRGYYGHNDVGRRVLFGKCIDQNGRFVGIIRGTWSPAVNDGRPEDARRGTFEGRLTTEDAGHVGNLVGRWHIAGGRPGRYDGTWWAVPEQPRGR